MKTFLVTGVLALIFVPPILLVASLIASPPVRWDGLS